MAFFPRLIKINNPLPRNAILLVAARVGRVAVVAWSRGSGRGSVRILIIVEHPLVDQQAERIADDVRGIREDGFSGGW